MFEELFPRYPAARYCDDAFNAGFRAVAGDVACDPEIADLDSIDGVIRSCMIGMFGGRRVVIFQNLFGGEHRPSEMWTLAFDIGEHDFRETNSLSSYWNIRRTGHWVYFEALIQFNEYPVLADFLRDTNEMVELYLL
jgi:hypothetical protein